MGGRFEPATVRAVGLCRFISSVQHLARSTLARALLSEPELVHPRLAVERPSHIRPGHRVKRGMVHKAEFGVECAGLLTTNVGTEVLGHVSGLFLAVEEDPRVFKREAFP